MAQITTRQTAGTGATVNPGPLSNAQIDNNFININTELVGKAPLNGTGATGTWPISITGSAANLTGGSNGALPYKSIVENNNYSVSFTADGSYLTIPADNDLLLSSSNFTIECWIKPTNTAKYNAIAGSWDSGGGPGWLLELNDFDNKLVFSYQTNLGYLVLEATSMPTQNVWSHIAVSRQGSNYRIFINGSLSGSVVNNETLLDGALDTRIGFVPGGVTASGSFRGSISNFRIVKGTALYTSAFTVPSSPLQAVTNTILLTAASATIQDTSAVSKPVTAVGSAEAVAEGPFGSGVIDQIQFLPIGTNDKYLSSNGTVPVWADLSPSAFGSQTANTVLAAPNGSSGTPTFRALVAQDIPALNQNTTGSAGTLLREDNRTISPSELTAGQLKFGFTSWNNDNSAPYADFLHARSYTDSSGGLDNLVMFRKDAIGIRVWQQTFGSATAYATFKDVAFTDSNITGSAASVSGTTTAAIGSGALGTGTADSTTFLRGDRTWAVVSLPSGQTAGSSTAGYLQYSGTTATAGQINGSTTAPSNTTRLNYEGNLHATNFYGDGSNLTSLPAGNLSGTIPSAVLTNSSVFIGTTSVALNRATSNLGLTGITSLYSGTGQSDQYVKTTTDAGATGTQYLGSGGVTGSPGNSGGVYLSSGDLNTSSGVPGTVEIRVGNASANSSGTISELKVIGGRSGNAIVGGITRIQGGPSFFSSTTAIAGALYLTGGTVFSSTATSKTTGSTYIDGGGSNTGGTIVYGSVFIGNQTNDSNYGTTHVTIGKTGTEVRLPGVGTSGILRLGANGAVSADTGLYQPIVSSQIASVTSPMSWNSDSFSLFIITAQATALTINADSGNPVNGERITFRIKDNGTAIALTWSGGTKGFRAMGVTIPTTTVANKTMYVGAIYNATDTFWDVIAVTTQA